MSNQNTSDLIEAYLKKILEESNKIEIRRAEMANLFNCVPSQINYELIHVLPSNEATQLKVNVVEAIFALSKYKFQITINY